jgi:hypothetical protein
MTQQLILISKTEAVDILNHILGNCYEHGCSDFSELDKDTLLLVQKFVEVLTATE